MEMAVVKAKRVYRGRHAVLVWRGCLRCLRCFNSHSWLLKWVGGRGRARTTVLGVSRSLGTLDPKSQKLVYLKRAMIKRR